MKRKAIPIIFGVLVAFQILGAGKLLPDNPFVMEQEFASVNTRSSSNEKLKKDAFEVLDVKCNSCHRRQNPLMVFKPQNMEKRAKKIDQMVFVERRMPKGNEFKLTDKEYNQLEKWLRTQAIY